MTATFFLKLMITVNMLFIGVVFAAASHPATAAVTNLLLDGIFWPLDGLQKVDTSAARLASGIGGGLLFGFGVACWLIVSRLMPREPALAKSILRYGLTAWFCLDSTASVLAGAPMNVAVNAMILLSLLAPLHFVHRNK